ncbi:MAG: LysR family transcriptional regulator [Pseudodesulfovibrio sp.]
MELYQLRTFAAVAEEGNLTRAAERIFASQPAVSAHVKALEEELGLPLFVRTPRGMQLTDAGRALKAKADSILRAAEDMLAQARGLRRELSGELTIALNTDPGFLRTAELISAMAETHPKVKIKLTQSHSATILKAVRDRKLDAGFSFFENPYAEVTGVRLRDVPVRVVAPIGWADEVRGKSIDQLALMPWILPDESCPFMRVVKGVFEDSGICPQNCVEADEEAVIGQLVAAGKGISVLKQSGADRLCAEGLAVICDAGPNLSLSISFVHPRNREQDPLIKALSEAVAAVWKD